MHCLTKALAQKDILHVVERVEQRVDELGAELQEVGKLLLEQVVVMLVFARGEFKVLLNLCRSAYSLAPNIASSGRWGRHLPLAPLSPFLPGRVERLLIVLTLKMFCSSFRLFSFLSLNLFKLLLCLSKSTSLCSRLVMVLRIFLQISFSSLQGSTIRDPINSNSGASVSFLSALARDVVMSSMLQLTHLASPP